MKETNTKPETTDGRLPFGAVVRRAELLRYGGTEYETIAACELPGDVIDDKSDLPRSILEWVDDYRSERTVHDCVPGTNQHRITYLGYVLTDCVLDATDPDGTVTRYDLGNTSCSEYGLRETTAAIARVAETLLDDANVLRDTLQLHIRDRSTGTVLDTYDVLYDMGADGVATVELYLTEPETHHPIDWWDPCYVLEGVS